MLVMQLRSVSIWQKRWINYDILLRDEDGVYVASMAVIYINQDFQEGQQPFQPDLQKVSIQKN